MKRLYYSIGEASEITGLKPYVLRYWETEFPSLSPGKNRAGNRIYREKDIRMIMYIKHLLYNEKYTIDGARRKIKNMSIDDIPDPSRLSKKNEESSDEAPVHKAENEGNEINRLRNIVVQLKQGLSEILTILDGTDS